jgi:peptide/nickel transport system substrate-binding protein
LIGDIVYMVMKYIKNPGGGGYRLNDGNSKQVSVLINKNQTFWRRIMITRKWLLVISLVTILSIVLAACATTTTAPSEPETVKETVVVKETEVVTEVEKEVVKETEIVEVVITPTPAPSTRTGGWLDQIVIIEEPSQEAAIRRMEAGEIDIFAFTVAKADLLKTVEESENLSYLRSFGSYNELTLNPYGPTFTTGGLNPFSSAKIREAVNWLIDRTYIAQEVTGGMAIPRFYAFAPTFADYAKYADIAAQWEAYYAYNLETAREIITAEMEALGATLVDGKWQYENAPVTLIGLIRTEDERTQIGDYFSNQLEEIGFTVDRQYKTAAEASPIWTGSVDDGQWHWYTGGWITTQVPRTEEDNFTDFYMPEGWPGNPLWDAYTNSETYRENSLKLYNREYSTLEERRELFEFLIPGSLQESQRVWTTNRASFTPFRSDVTVVGDLAGAVAGSRLWPYTLRRIGVEGGAMTMAMPSILTNPWNPLGGSNWIYDQAITRATSDDGLLPNPWTGLNLPQRAEKAEVTAKEGLPIGVTSDWVTLTFAPEIEVPADAFIDWNPETQTFITVGEASEEPVTAAIKSVIYYPAELKDIKWHDGSPIDVADFVMVMIMNFDRGYEASAVYDPAAATTLNVFKSTFKGFKIVSEDPLVIEYYTDNWQPDAENNVADLWPLYGYGPASWHSMAVGLLGEAAGEVAFSQAKSKDIEKEWMNFISGPSVETLKGFLAQATTDNYIPYEATLGQYITAEEATERWTNYNEFVRTRGHFWIGTGAYYLERAFPVEGIVVLRNFLDFPDLASKWATFGAPPIPVIDITAPAEVKIGEEATFEVMVTFNDVPYAQDDLLSVSFLLFGATGELVTKGEAEFVSDGMYMVTISAEDSAKLTAGSAKLTVVVVSALESIPGFESVEFVATE